MSDAGKDISISHHKKRKTKPDGGKKQPGSKLAPRENGLQTEQDNVAAPPSLHSIAMANTATASPATVPEPTVADLLASLQQACPGNLVAQEQITAIMAMITQPQDASPARLTALKQENSAARDTIAQLQAQLKQAQESAAKKAMDAQTGCMQAQVAQLAIEQLTNNCAGKEGTEVLKQIMTQNDTLQSRVRDAVLEIDKLKSEKDIAVGEEKNAQKLLRTKQETIDRLNQLSKEDEARYNSKIELLNKQIECAMQKANAQDKAMIQKLTDKLLTKDQENEKSQRIITTLRSQIEELSEENAQMKQFIAKKRKREEEADLVLAEAFARAKGIRDNTGSD